MSRMNVARSRMEKAGKGPASAPTPAHTTQEIVPGKYNENDWNTMMEKDDGDEFVGDILEDICSNALNIIYANYIEEQLLPYTITQAKDAILQIVEWQFLARDEGELNTETNLTWQEDEEPEPAVTDCWAQGSVPRQFVPPVLEEVKESEEGDSQVMDQQEYESQVAPSVEDVTSRPDEESNVDTEESTKQTKDNEEELAESVQKEDTQTTQESVAKSRRKKFRPHRGPLKSAGLGKMTLSLEQTEMELLRQEAGPTPPPPDQSTDISILQMPSSIHSLLKLQAGRPPGAKDVMYDERGNIMGMTKIDPAKLPSHHVNVRCLVVDPAVEAAQARLEAMRTGRYLAAKDSKVTTSTQRPVVKEQSKTTRAGSIFRKPTDRRKDTHPVTPLPPPLLDIMELSPGVIVREGDRVKRGPRQHPRRADILSTPTEQALKPIGVRSTMPLINVTDLLENHTPIIKPMRPIPPIAPRPPSYAGQ